jgi:hypothetical protein
LTECRRGHLQPANRRRQRAQNYRQLLHLTSLINRLLVTALEPAVADRLRGKRGKKADLLLLDIKVVDLAAGSGHFLPVSCQLYGFLASQMAVSILRYFCRQR